MPPHSRDFSHELGGNYKKIINFIFSDNPSEKKSIIFPFGTMNTNNRPMESYRKELDYEDHDRLRRGNQTLQSYTEG